jgi:hypothetical protein
MCITELGKARQEKLLNATLVTMKLLPEAVTEPEYSKRRITGVHAGLSAISASQLLDPLTPCL